MFSDKVFQISILVSLAVHTAILFSNPNFYSPATDKPPKKMELSYIRTQKEEIKVLPKNITPKREQFMKLPPKIEVQKITPPQYFETATITANKDNLLKDAKEAAQKQAVFNKPAIFKPDIISVKKKITLPPIDLDKISNPSYISYYQIVREKIRRAAYQNYTRTEQGEVYLSFIISSDGDVMDVRLVEDKSSANSYLRQTALRSIKDASPFPNFPKELDYPQLSFNIVISFEIE